MADETPLARITDPPLAPLSLFGAEDKNGGSDSGKAAAAGTFIQPAVSFKEESNLVSDLSDSERIALDELKTLLRQALDDDTLISSHPKGAEPSSLAEGEEGKEDAVEAFRRTPCAHVSIWGIPFLEDERSDVVLLKFLRARDFRVKDAFEMIGRTISWRIQFGVDDMVNEEQEQQTQDGDLMEKVVFMHGHDRERHPVCYNVYGEFRDNDLYEKTFSDEEKRRRFLRWRIRFLERNVRKLDFGAGGVNTLVQVNDLKNAPGPGRTELRIATKQALQLLQDNYPEFVAKQVFINVPWWYIAFYAMLSPFMTQRTKSKFVFAGPARTADTLFKYISPEQVPIQYGGLSVDSCDCNPEFTMDDPATEVTIKPTTKQFVEILVSERCIIVWEIRVVGWEVTYGAEFVPCSKDGYTVIIQKAKKMRPTDDPVISSRYKISEVGKIVLTIDNPSFKKRKLLYRYKVLPYTD